MKLPKLTCKILVYKLVQVLGLYTTLMLTSIKYTKCIFQPSLCACTHKPFTNYRADLALSLLLSCKLPARLTHWQKVRCNVIPLVGFGDLQPLFTLAKVKFIWKVARKDRWNTGSRTNSC